MNFGLVSRVQGRTGHAVVATMLAMSLAACGGGGGSAGSTGVAAGAGATGGTGSTGGVTGTTPAATPTLALNLTDGSATSITALSGGQTGVVRAVFKDATGNVIPNAVVKFTASDATLVQFTPVSASALTDSKGVATINIKPTDFTSAGALTLSAQAVADSKSGAGSVNISIGAASLAVGSVTLTPAPTVSLPAFNSVTVLVPVTSNGQSVSTAPGLTFSSLCKGDGTATIVAGSVTNGVATATYTNTGCVRGSDTITAAIGNSSGSVTLPVSSANIGTINFVSSSTSGTSLVLKGSGGLGRSESAVLTYKVVDQAGTGLGGVLVKFAATTTTGGLQVLPAQATTDSTGTVQTSVQSGTIPTPVRVAAQASRNGSTITGLSDALTISTGLPIQKAMSISADKYNIEGLEYDGVQANITVRMADQYGNPISDGTTVNFVTEGGAVGSSSQGACQTVNGGCTVPLTSQSFRPVNGRVTVLAYAQGIEDFTDTNGDGQYSCTNFTSGDNTTPSTFRPLIDTCVSGGEAFQDLPDAYLDTGLHSTLKRKAGQSAPAGTVVANYPLDLGVDGVRGLTTGLPLDGTYEPGMGDLPFPYNHSSYSASGDGHWGINYIRRSVEIIFSGSGATLIRVDPSTLDDFPNPNNRVIAGLAGAGCADQDLAFRLVDVNGNPLPAGTTVVVSDAVKVTPGKAFPAEVLSTPSVDGTYHAIRVLKETSCASGGFNVVVTSPKGIGRLFSFTSN